MDPNPVIHEISSDEEVGLGEYNCGGDDNYDWITELLGEVDKETDDSDEVLVVAEVPPKQRIKSSSAVKSSVNDVDDDCVILDGDPDNPVGVVNDSGNGSDDLLIVCEKGQIACRDYPHSRHCCAKFPFSSTSHEKHCELCHCYVCDSLAPCDHWGTGTSNHDHCHATDKEDAWKLLRIEFKKGKTGPLPIPKFLDAPFSAAQPPANLVPPLDRLQSNTMPLIQISRPNAIRACSSSRNFGIPNIISQGRSPRSGYGLARNRFHPRLVSQHLHGTWNNTSRQGRGQSVSGLDPHFVPSHAMFKRAGPVGGGLTHRSSFTSASVNHLHATAPKYSANPPPTTLSDRNPVNCWEYNPIMNLESGTYQSSSQSNTNDMVTPNDKNSLNWRDYNSIMNSESGTYQSSSQPNISNMLANAMPSQPPLSSQHIPQPNDGQSFYYQQQQQQQGDQIQNVAHPTLSDFNISWLNDTSLSSRNFHDDSQLQNAAPTSDPSTVTEYNPELPGLAKPDPSPLELEFENWIAENQSVSRGPDETVPAALDTLSPEPGMLLFDFETAWMG
ncbi:uncharacterized protein LOC131155150 isoform X2 [Malania oleifera]|uniref:uncharacterized protein LOC131155150 isoform X2 n=1 Tax=Malania oleifera TaxID=397392 RepID=UPI0025AE8C7C|nr:uncharacterized protein LOC131155150 isoform X2 [Malania oleifera]